MRDGDLFLRTVGDIEQAVNSKDGYEVLRASALARQLLIDGFPLIDRVNRKCRVPIRFRIIDEWDGSYTKTAMALKPEFYSVIDGLDPESALGNVQPIEVGRDRFLDQRVIYAQGRFYTVYDVIDHCANVMGGVHKANPKTDQQKGLEALQNFEIGGLAVSLAQLRSILRVIVTALKPLAERVKGCSL